MGLEQSEGFKILDTALKDLEHQLSLCDASTKICEQSAVEAAKEIEDHFARCMDLLVARKEVLLREVLQRVEYQSM